jgi:hypothetical protein
MSAFAKIDAALIAGFRAGAFFSDSNVAFENRDFTQPTTEWAKVTNMPNVPSPSSIGSNGSDENDGVFQVDLYFPQNTGKGLALAKADAIAGVFKAGASFTNSGQAVLIERCGISPAKNEDAWLRIMVSIYWRAFVYR